MAGNTNAPLVVIRIGNNGIDEISLNAESDSQECTALKLYTAIRPVIQLIDGVLKNNKNVGGA